VYFSHSFPFTTASDENDKMLVAKNEKREKAQKFSAPIFFFLSFFLHSAL
jgi:hypothetical protein